MVQMNFNYQQLADQGLTPNTGGQDVFETGEYLFHLTGSEMKDNSKQTGRMLVLTASCLEDGMTSKRLQIRLNIQNPSAQAVEIAMRDLMAISSVCGVLNWTDSQQLHGKPFRIRVEKTTYKKNDGSEGESNDIKGFSDANGNPPGAQQATGGGAPAAPGAPTPPAPPAQPPAPTQQPPAPTQPPAPVQQQATQPVQEQTQPAPNPTPPAPVAEQPATQPAAPAAAANPPAPTQPPAGVPTPPWGAPS